MILSTSLIILFFFAYPSGVLYAPISTYKCCLPLYQNIEHCIIHTFLNKPCSFSLNILSSCIKNSHSLLYSFLVGTDKCILKQSSNDGYLYTYIISHTHIQVYPRSRIAGSKCLYVILDNSCQVASYINTNF